MEMEKTVMVQHMGRVYVGNPRYEMVSGDGEGNGKAPDIEILVEVENAYEFSTIATLMPDEKSGKLGVLTAFGTFKIGTIISVPDEAVVAELANDSSMYREYVKVTTGIKVANPGEIPPGPAGAYKRPH